MTYGETNKTQDALAEIDRLYAEVLELGEAIEELTLQQEEKLEQIQGLETWV